MGTMAQRLAQLAYLICNTFAFFSVGCAVIAQPELASDLAQATGICPEEPDWFFSWDYSGDWSHARSDEHRAEYPSDPFVRFDGWATVERSSATELILAADSQLNGLRDAPASANANAHCNIYGRDLPAIAPGARLWLHFSGDFVPGAARALYYRHDFGREMSVRAQPDGPLLLAGITSPAEAGRIETDALTFAEPVELCGMENTNCWVDGRVSQHSLLAIADEPQRVSAGPGSVITLDGMPYALTFVGASQYVGTQRDHAKCHPDFSGDIRLWASADLRAVDPQPIIAALDQGVVPACSVGNEPVVDVDASLYGASASTWIADAEIVYRAIENDKYMFDVPGTEYTFGLTLNALQAEPAPGTRYSVSYQFDAFVMRSQPGGEIMAAWMWLPETPKDRDTIGIFSSWLTLPLTRDQVCPYEPERSPAEPGQFLRQITFGTQPATAIREGSRGVLSIDGRSYEALVSKVRRATIVWITPQR